MMTGRAADFIVYDGRCYSRGMQCCACIHAELVINKRYQTTDRAWPPWVYTVAPLTRAGMGRGTRDLVKHVKFLAQAGAIEKPKWLDIVARYGQESVGGALVARWRAGEDMHYRHGLVLAGSLLRSPWSRPRSPGTSGSRRMT